MDKKVDTALMGGQKNSMTERAPLAPGYEEADTPSAADALSKAVAKVEPSYDELNVPENDPDSGSKVAEALDDLAAAGQSFETVTATEGQREQALRNVLNPDYEPMEPAPSAKDAADMYDSLNIKPKSEIEELRAMVLNLTKRLEDFGAIPKEADLEPHVPVVTITAHGNKRTDW